MQMGFVGGGERVQLEEDGSGEWSDKGEWRDGQKRAPMSSPELRHRFGVAVKLRGSQGSSMAVIRGSGGGRNARLRSIYRPPVQR